MQARAKIASPPLCLTPNRGFAPSVATGPCTGIKGRYFSFRLADSEEAFFGVAGEAVLNRDKWEEEEVEAPGLFVIVAPESGEGELILALSCLLITSVGGRPLDRCMASIASDSFFSSWADRCIEVSWPREL